VLFNSISGLRGRFLALMAGLLLTVAAGAWYGVAAQTDGQVPGHTLGQTSDSDFWRALRAGTPGAVSIPDAQAGVVIRADGQSWLMLRNGPVQTYGSWLLLGTVAVLALFLALRGRIRIAGGRCGRTISRFSLFERLVHWLTAGTFILLGLSGLNTLYGRIVLLDLLGPESFAALTMASKMVHVYLGFVFMACLVLILLMWLRHNGPTVADFIWLARGGGLIGKAHPPAHKFNAGQKILFWLVILGGATVSYSGLNLVFPFAYEPTVQGMQTLQLLHAVAALVMLAVIIGHIYIGTLGMEGAFEAMWQGTVDENWARSHHSLWTAAQEDGIGGKATPSE
jgi:formate dehydrogenase subunit gamma